LVVAALEAEGIELCFGIPGTHNIELYDALAVSDRVRTVLVTDEQSASFMADGAWRASGRMACVNVVPGAGLTHALSGIAEAFMDNVPMLVLGCGIRRDTGRAYQLHDIDQLALVAPVTKGRWRPERGEDVGPALREACRLARSGAPGPVFVEVPAELYLFRHAVDRARLPPAAADLPAVPDAGAVGRAASLLQRARRPLLYVGAGTRGAVDEVRALAERLEMPVSTTFTGKGVFPESHPLFLWPGFGAAAPGWVRAVADGCDATLAVGCRFSEVGTGSYGLTPPPPLVHVDIDASVIGRNYAVALGVAADARAFLVALLDALRGAPARAPDPVLREAIRRGHAQALGERRPAGAAGVDPACLLATLQATLGPDAVYTADSGNGTFLAVEGLRLDGPGRFLAPVDYSCMGYSVPAALGAKLACPEAPVVALAGDGAFLMTGLELVTAAQEGLGVVVVVLRDRELAQIAQFQATALRRKSATRLADYELRHLARATGSAFFALERDADCPDVLARARDEAAGGRPVIVEVAIDYSRRTHFTRGVVKTNLLRLPVADRLRFVGRALVRRITG
jgi:acetolactate synthase-1/2/3 large subunit